MKGYTRGQNACYIYTYLRRQEIVILSWTKALSQGQGFVLWYKVCTVLQSFELWYKVRTVVQMFELLEKVCTGWYKSLDCSTKFSTVCHGFGLWNRCLEHVCK
jgi:hypothetical protein